MGGPPKRGSKDMGGRLKCGGTTNLGGWGLPFWGGRCWEIR